MNYRTLGRTGLRISIVGMGTGGGPDPLGQKSGIPETQIHALLHRAFDLGINFFDTAPGYMDSESILGRALGSLPRDKLIVSSKIALAGSMPGEPIQVMRADQIEAAIDTSLRRLQMEYLDVLLMGVAGTEHFDLVMNEHMPVLRRLQSAGKFRFLGSSELSRSDGSHEWLQRILPTGELDVAMVAHNMINQSAQRTVFPICRERDIGVLNVFTVRRVFGVPGRLREVVEDLKARGVIDAAVGDEAMLEWLVKDREAGSIIEAAYRYAAYTPGVTTVMNGANDVRMLEQNIGSVHRGPLSSAAVERLGRLFGRVAEAVGN